MGRITYTAVVLDEKSRSMLLANISGNIPKGWEVLTHHMTINMGKIKPEFERYLGDEVTLRVTKFGMSDKAMAVKVEGFPSMNKVPHITVAVNREIGGKPHMSKDITDWRPIQFGFELKGTVTEVPW